MKKSLFVLVALAVTATAMLALSGPATAGGVTQVSGIAYPPGTGPDPGRECVDFPGANYVIYLTGDLDGCLYGFIDNSQGPNAAGAYKEIATETFVGSYGSMKGTWMMTENFHGKYDLTTDLEIHGFCKHPIISGRGTGDFEGVGGRLDFKDDVSDPLNPVFPYKGHLALE